MKSSASTKRAGEGGWISWLRRFFQGSPARPANTQAHASATPRAEAPGPPPTAAALEASSAHCPELASYAQALGLTLIAPSPLTEAQQVEAEQLTAAIVAADASDEAVPSGLPTAALRTLNLVAKPDLELSDLASAVQQDPALTAAVLRVANSAAVSGAAGPIRTVREAITRLGVSESARVAGVVAAQTLFSPQSKRALALFGLRLCELHVAAATIAGSAAQLSMERRVGRMDLTYLGGMLHEVGKTLALSTLAHMIQSGHAPQDIQPAVLEAVLDRVHVSLGGRAHRSWELPAYLIALCETQYAPTIPHDSEHTEQHLVRVVSGLHQLRARPLPRERLLCIADSLQALALTPAQARALDSGLRARTQQVRQILG